MYNSFYGGKQGHSYNIVAHYDSVKDMVTAFNNGGNYTDVAFDEYVIIDTIVNLNQKNNPENGLIYRRGYNFSEGFALLGQTNEDTGEPLTSINPEETITITLYANVLDQEISSTNMPTSGSFSVDNITVPRFYNYSYKIIDITPEPDDNEEESGEEEEPIEPEEEEEIARIYQVVLINNYISFNDAAWIKAWNEFVTHPGGGAIYVGQIVGPTGGAAAIQMIPWAEFKEHIADDWSTAPYQNSYDMDIVPGYDPTKISVDGYDAEGFFDKIQYGYCTLKDLNGNVTDAYLAFNFPYTVFRVEAHKISPYPVSTYFDFENSEAWPEGVVFEDNIYSYTDPITGKIYNYNDTLHLWQQDDGSQNYADPVTKITYSYNDDTRIWDYDNLASENIDSQSHNFYKHYDIQIPGSIKGEGLERVFITNNANEELPVNTETGILNVINENNRRTYQVKYQTRRYDENEDGILSEEIPIGTYNVFTQITTEQVQNPTEDPRYEHQYDSTITFNYTAKDPDIFINQIVERIWVQETDDDTLLAYNGEDTSSLLQNHLYVLYSNFDLPVDLGVMNEILAVWNESVAQGRPQDYTLTALDNHGNPLLPDYNYLITTGNRDENGAYIPICLGITRKIAAVGRLDTIPDANVFEFNTIADVCVDCNSLPVADRSLRCYKIDTTYYFYDPIDETLPIIADNFNSNFTAIDISSSNLGQFYTYFNDGTTSLLPITEIEKIAFKGDLLLIRFRNLDLNNVQFPASLIEEYQGEMYINLGSTVRGNHVYTNFLTLDELKEAYPYGFGNDIEGNEDIATRERAGWLASVGHDTDVILRLEFDQNDNIIGQYSVSEADAVITIVNDEPTISYPEGSQYDPTDPPTNLIIEEPIGYKFYAYDYRTQQWYAVQDLAGASIRAEYSLLVAKPDALDETQPDDENKNYLNESGVWFVVTE